MIQADERADFRFRIDRLMCLQMSVYAPSTPKRNTHRADNRSQVMRQMGCRTRVGPISYGLGFATD